MAAKKKTKKKTGSKAGANALEFCRIYLRKKKKAPFAEVRDAAKKKGLVLYPISYGRAKALEGLVPVAKYGTGKAKRAKSGRGPGRPKGSKNKPKPGALRASAASVSIDSIDDLVRTVKNMERERNDAMATLDRIRALLG